MKNKGEGEQWNDLEIYLFFVHCSWKWTFLFYGDTDKKKSKYKSNSKLTLFVGQNWANRNFDYLWLIRSAEVEVTFTTTEKKFVFWKEQKKKIKYINIIIGMPSICLIKIIWYKKVEFVWAKSMRGRGVRESDIRGFGNQTVI